MINFYNAADNALYKRPDSQFITQERFRGNVAPVPQEVEEVTETFGIPNTEVFQSMENGGNNFNYNNNNNNVGGFRTPGTGEDGRFQSPSGNYVTNRVNSGGYIPGLEPEENYLSKIAKTAGRGIMGMIPGGSLMMGFADKLDRFDDLSPFAQEYTRQQMANQEQSMHGGNLTNQDRYGYNKRSALGDYDALVSKRVDMAKAWQAANPGKELPDIHSYYLDKEKDKDTLKSQLDMNDIVRNHVMNQRAQNGPAINNPYSDQYSGNTKSPNYAPTGPNQPDPTPTNNGGDRDPSQGNTQTGFGKSGMGRDPDDRMAKGGRVGYYFGGLAARGMKR